MPLYRYDPSVPDNIEPSDFVPSLKINEKLRSYSFIGLLKYPCGCISRQASIAFIFFAVWDRLCRREIDPTILIALAFFSMLMTIHKTFNEMMSVVAIFCFQWVLAPVNLTLTHSWSEDTVRKVGCLGLALHVLCYPYAKAEKSVGLAINSAFFASMVLASRLEEAYVVFAFTSFTMVTFAYAPAMFQNDSPWSCLACVVLAVILTPLSWPPMLSCYVGSLFVINGVGPMVFLSLMRYKAFLQGSWDISDTISPRSPT